MSRLGLCCVAALGAACATRPPPAAAGPLAGMHIIDGAVGRETSAKVTPMTLPFGPGANGNALVHEAIARARDAGSSAIGELSFVMTFHWHDSAVECRTDILFDGDPRLRPRPTAATPAPAMLPPTPYSTDIEDFRPQRLSFVARDRELVCKKVQQTTWKMVTVEEERFNAEARRARDRNPRRERVMQLEWVDRCEWQELVRPAERYDYELAMGFVPPSLDALSRKFADGQLVAAPPRCYRVDEPLAGPANRLVVSAYQRGAVPQKNAQNMLMRSSEKPRTVPMGDDKASKLAKQNQ